MINKIQYYISYCINPYENLATEKYLLDTNPNDCCTLYLWQNQNTVVIGRNQNPWAECKCSLLESENGKLARRLSGGGAVFHDLGNLNFTFICATDDYDVQKQLQVIQKACEMAGISVEVSGRNDILADGKKFSGNAFYSSKGKSYHHGTLLISADMERMQRYLTPPKAKLENKGVKSVRSRVINLSELAPNLDCQTMTQHMISAFGNVYGITPTELKGINSDEIVSLTNKYSSWDYLYGSTIPFTFSCEDNFEWGNVELHLQVTEGFIKTVKLYTDSMDWTLPELIQKALLDCRFEFDAIKKAISSNLPAYMAEDFLRMFNKSLMN